MDNYTIYHLHSDLSTGVTSIDSVTKPAQYIARAKECGMKALAFSEHGSVFMWVKKKQMIEAAGMKYIHAEEFYLTESLDNKIKDNYHIVVIAKNYDGVLELNTLSSRAFCRTDNHYYYVPRITMDELEQTSDNLLITSACLASPLSKGNDVLKQRFLDFMIAHKDRCYLEIQHHDVGAQKRYNLWLYETSQTYGIPLIAGTDTHALNQEHAEARIVLQKSKNIRFPDEETWDLTFKTYDELIESYAKQGVLPMDVVLEAIENTNRMADRVEEFTLDKSYKYPALWDDPKKVFIKKIKEGIKRRGVDKYPNRDEYAKRIEYEIKAYEHNGAFDFMLLMEDIISWCRSQDIPIGYGRGSVNGSVCAWLLGITEMDAIKHNLNFDRFMNVERVSLSDIDTDFPPDRIDEVKQYVFNHHGLYCSDIITFNTIADKGAIRDICRALYKDTNDDYMRITDDALALFERSEDDARAKYPEVFKYVDICKGVVISIGSHPCFTKDALVLTDTGYKTIDEIKKGDKVLTHKKRYKEVADVIITENNSDFYDIKTGLLNIKATGNHPFYIRKPSHIRFRGKDYVETTIKTYNQPEWINARDIEKGDMLGMPVNNESIIPFHPQYASLNFASDNFWWIVGRYIGDGWITHNTNRNTRYLVICCDHTGTELSEILSKIKLESFDYRVEDRKETYRIYIKNMELLEYLESLGKYAYGKYLTNDIFDLPREQLRSFIQGYMSADGSYVKEYNTYMFKTVSKKLALGLSMCIAKVYMVPVTCSIHTAHMEVLLGRTVNCKEKYQCSFHLDKRKKDRNLYENGYVWLYCYGASPVDGIERTYNLSVYDDNSYTVNNMAVHNCGLVVAPYPIDDKMGLCTTSTDPLPISQIYMKEIDGLNYVKLDLLKLDTIQLIHDACKAANIDMLTPDNTDINDVDVWNSIRDNTVGIFQWEGATGDGYIKKLMSDDNIRKLQQYAGDVDRMTLLTIGNSAIRPAGASYRDDLASGVVRKSGSAAIDDFLKPTFGYLVFQCQIIEFLHSYCGFTMGEADIVRRCVDENSEVTMSDGTVKKIRDINIGDTVQSYNDVGTTVSSVVTNVFDNGISNDMYEITASNGYIIKATGSHKILTQRGWITVSELTNSDYIMTPDKLNATTDGLRPNQRLSSSDLLLLGLLIGDGTLGDKWYIALTNSDLSLLDRFVECVNARLRNHKEEATFNITSANGIEVDTVYTYAIASGAYKDSVQHLLEKLGLNVKAKSKHIPECIMQYPANEKILHLLGGLFSTDGGYDSTTQSIDYYSISYDLVRDIKHLLLKFGIYSYIMRKYVPEYEYFTYVLRIQQIDSLYGFRDIVYPYMVGDKKRAEFHTIFQYLCEYNTRYNYLLPRECVEEIRENMRIQHRSFNELDIPIVRQCYDSVTDVKARKLIQNVYIPYTYKMLMADYQPRKIKSITKIDACHVYDIEVENTHNYVANGIIVHNCFAKKLGTEAWLPIIKNGGTSLGGNQRYIPGFINTMKEKYDMSVAEAEQTITSFLKVIEDASDYLFSVNHSTPYSYEGYVCGWLRYHYPLQFLTCALNICKDNEEKTLALISYAKEHGIKLMPPKFGFSKNDYEFDIDTNAIYKGLSSVKFLGDNVSEELDKLSGDQHDDFVDLLVALQNTSINSKQLKILINIGFFDKFGGINELLREYVIFDSLYGRKQLKVKDLDSKGVPQWLAEKHSTKHTEKTFYFDNTIPLIKDIIANTEHLTNSIIDQIRGEVINLGCGLSTAEVGADWYCIQSISGFSNNVFTLYQMRFGVTETYKFDYKCRGGLDVGDVIKINKIEHRHKRRKIADKWVEIDDMEDVVTSIKKAT